MSIRSRLIKGVLLPIDEWREGRRILPLLRRLERSQYGDASLMERERSLKLRRLLAHAYENSRFYRERFREAGVHPEEIRDPSDLRRLPPLTKADMKAHLEEMVAANVPRGYLHRSATGGSTGEHTPFYQDAECLNPKIALEYRFNRWAGWDVGEPIAFVWPAIQDFAGTLTLRTRLRNALLDRRLMLYCGRLDELTLAEHARRLRDFAPTLIRAFPNPLWLLAQHLNENGGAPVRPRGIITVGEPLLDAQRALFEEVFGCPVFNCYVSRECGNIAGECEMHRGLHLNAESLIVECLHNDRPVEPGEPGEVVITDLENRGMPLIRYRIGDIGSLMPGPCACGRALPLMSMQAGRISDFLVSPHDRSYVSGASLCHYLIAEGPGVGQVQLLQKSIDELTIRIVRDRAAATDERHHFEAVIREIFRGKMRVRYEVVESIPREPSGKYMFCKCLLNQESRSPGANDGESTR